LIGTRDNAELDRYVRAALHDLPDSRHERFVAGLANWVLECA
jgi:hypothetical protein